MGIGAAPFVGTLQSIVELGSGRDYITGEPASRGLAAAGIVAGIVPGGKTALKGGANLAGKLFGHSDELVEAAVKAAPNTTSLGITRNNPADWRVTRDLWDNSGYGDILSDANRAAIARGRTPVVDQSWIRHYPEDAGLVGERISMHHIGGGPITVPLPFTRHVDAHMPGGFGNNPGGPGSSLPIYPPRTGN